MKGNKKTFFVLALLLLVGITSGYIANTYAKYASKITANGTATVARWNFYYDNQAQTVNVNLAGTVNTDTLAEGKIAPGTSGSFNIALTNTNTDTGVNYTVKLKSITNSPTNLVFCKTDAAVCAEADKIVPGTTEITGTLKANQGDPANVPIYWKWAFGSNDLVDDPTNKADTTDGEEAAGIAYAENGTPTRTEPTADNDPGKLAIGVEITGVQVEPVVTPPTTPTN